MLEGRLSDPPKKGLIFVRLCILVLFCVFSLRLWFLQVYRGDQFAAQARENRLRKLSIYAPRGMITDRSGTLVATNKPAYSLTLTREECTNIDKCLRQVSKWTGLPLSELYSRFERGKKRSQPFEAQVLIADLPFRLVARIEANAPQWPELRVVSRPRRHYPYGRDLAHVLGYVAQASEQELKDDPKLRLGDRVGKQGLEKVFDRRLRGRKGVKEVEIDAVGRVLREQRVQAPKAGDDLRLNIDLPLQCLAMDLLKDKAGVIIVLEPRTGQVLALASAPSFDANLFVEGISKQDWQRLLDHPRDPLQNRAVQSGYPPGSVFKLVMTGCGLHEADIDPEKEIKCDGEFEFGDRTFRCWKERGHGQVDLSKALVQSCDVYFYNLGQRLGVDRISAYAQACGFGTKTGIDLPHEHQGLVPNREWKRRRCGQPWHGGETINMSIGQGSLLVTPMQIAQFVAALVNGGKVLKPQLISGSEVLKQVQLPLDRPERQRIVRYMIKTVESRRGTAHILKTPGIKIGAKTGTAQVVKFKEQEDEDQEVPYKQRDHAWMASFGEQGGQGYVVVTLVEHGGHGGETAGPLTKTIYGYLFSKAMQGSDDRK